MHKALLIGVPTYDLLGPDLPFVVDELGRLGAALEASGYGVDVFGTESNHSATLGMLRNRIGEFLSTAESGSSLLLMFSGHGVRDAHGDYLVPRDGSLRDPFDQHLVRLDFRADLENTRAADVLIVVDACRTGFVDERKALALYPRRYKQEIQDRRAAILFACVPTEESQYVRDGERQFSLFTEALVTTIEGGQARQVGELVTGVRTELARLTKHHGKSDQVPDLQVLSSKPVDDMVVCPSVATALATRPGTRAWRRSLEDELIPNALGDDAAVWRDVLIGIADLCHRIWTDLQRTYPNDPWRDDRYPVRVARRFDFLRNGASAEHRLSPAEVAVGLAVPFIREAMVSIGVMHLVEGSPDVLTPSGAASGPRALVEQAHRAHPSWVRRAADLAGRDPDASTAVTAWLLYRGLDRLPGLWQLDADGLLDQFSLDLHAVIDGASDLVAAALDPPRLAALAWVSGADPTQLRDENKLRPSQPLLPGTGQEQSLRERMLGELLMVASRLAIDVRTLDPIVVEHVGLSDPLRPADVVSVVDAVAWYQAGQGRTLTGVCDHPAIDAALRAHVAVTSDIVERIHAQEQERSVPIPAFTTADGLRPCEVDGGRAYELPHVRFRLAHDEVRELLMGERLYGRPELALRELYQNALDACRYREARRAYLEWSGADLLPWDGQIGFRTGTDVAGRPYVECRDNGVGMGRNEIEQLFARAGRRFADAPEFIEEQSDWARCDPPVTLFPNSQFGIGVMSYFMLADELEVETRRYRRDGSLGETVLVSISGGASLFRMRSAAGGGDAGTRVRLYLTAERADLDCVEGLANLVVAQYRTTVDQGSRRVAWDPGRPGVHSVDALRDGIWESGVEGLWWVIRPEEGRVLADGLAVGSGFSYVMEDQGGIPGAIVDLREADAPTLSVDRTKVLAFDVDVVHRRVRDATTFPPSDVVQYRWLWAVATAWPGAADRLLTEYAGATLPASGRFGEPRGQLPVAIVGCFVPDQQILSALEGAGRWDRDNSALVIAQVGPFEYSVAKLPLLVILERLRVLVHAMTGKGWDEMRDRATRALALLTRFRSEIESGEDDDTLRLMFAELAVPNLRSIEPIIEPTCLIAGDEYLLLSSGSVDAGAVVAVSSRHGRSLRRVLQRVDQLGAYGIEPPVVDGGVEDWIPPFDLHRYTMPLTSAGLLAYGAAKGLTFAELATELSALRAFGITLAVPTDLASTRVPSAVGLLEDENVFVWRSFEHRFRDKVGFRSIVDEAQRRQTSLGELSDQLAWMSSFGIELPELHGLRSVIPTGSDRAILSALDESVNRPHPLLRVHDVGLTEALRRLQGWLPDDPRFSAIDLSGDDDPIEEVLLVALSLDLDAEAPWVWPEMTVEHIRRAAAHLGVPVPELRDRLARLAPLGLTVPDSNEVT